MFFLRTLQTPKVDGFSRKISTWQLYSKMVSKVDLPWRVNVGDLLNASWPLATPQTWPDFPEFAPCSNPDCENITRLGYSLSASETRFCRVTGDPFSGYLCRVCYMYRRTHDEQLPTAAVLEGLMTVSRIRGWMNKVRKGLIPDAVIECSKEGCKTLEENNAVGKDRFSIRHGKVYCPRHYNAVRAIERYGRMSQAARSKRRKAANLAWAAKDKREGKVCQVEHCGISVHGHLASGKQPRFTKHHGKDLCHACHERASRGTQGAIKEHKVARVALKLQLESMNGVIFHCGTPNCTKMMPPWPPIGTPEDTKKLNRYDRLTDTGAIREKLPGRFRICGTTLGLHCINCHNKKRLPQLFILRTSFLLLVN